MSVNASNISLTSANSTAPLNPSPSQPPQKDYAAALANLQTTYGGHGLMPTPVHAIPSQFSTTNTKKPSGPKDPKAAQSQQGGLGSLFSRLTSRLGFSADESESHLPSEPKKAPSVAGQKDYETAFGELSAQYGHGSGGPSMPRKL